MRKYAINMHLKYNYMHQYANNMHKYAIGKYAQICPNMWKNAKYMQGICKYMQGLRLVLFCENMQDICTYMQNMQARILYAVYAHIFIPHFADGASHCIGYNSIAVACCSAEAVPSVTFYRLYSRRPPPSRASHCRGYYMI